MRPFVLYISLNAIVIIIVYFIHTMTTGIHFVVTMVVKYCFFSLEYQSQYQLNKSSLIINTTIDYTTFSKLKYPKQLINVFDLVSDELKYVFENFLNICFRFDIKILIVECKGF